MAKRCLQSGQRLTIYLNYEASQDLLRLLALGYGGENDSMAQVIKTALKHFADLKTKNAPGTIGYVK